jgi:hypothetical protein
MALALQGRDRGRAALLGMMHRQPLLHFRDCDDVDRALHQDGRTSPAPAGDTIPRIATPTHPRQVEALSGEVNLRTRRSPLINECDKWRVQPFHRLFNHQTIQNRFIFKISPKCPNFNW